MSKNIENCTKSKGETVVAFEQIVIASVSSNTPLGNKNIKTLTGLLTGSTFENTLIRYVCKMELLKAL